MCGLARRRVDAKALAGRPAVLCRPRELRCCKISLAVWFSGGLSRASQRMSLTRSRHNVRTLSPDRRPHSKVSTLHATARWSLPETYTW